MLRKKWKRTLKVVTSAMLATSLVACNSGAGGATTAGTTPGTEKSAETTKASEAKKGSEKLTRISLYPPDGSISSGVVGGWKGEYFASLGFELEVWAYSEEKTNAILASGDLPDVMCVKYNNVNDVIESGMIMNLDEYLEGMPHVQAFEQMDTALNYVRKFRSADTGSVYGLPVSVGDNSSVDAVLDSTNRNGLKLNWEIYEEIGAPPINNTDDIIDVMAQMMEAHPTDENGNPYWGTILHNGSDSEYWGNIQLYERWFGYDEWNLPYMLETNMFEGTVSSILQKDSVYYDGLKWYNKAYKRGMIDSGDINRDRQTQKAKVDGGYAMVPMSNCAGWSPGYLECYFPGQKIYYNSSQPYGGEVLVTINAKTEKLDASLKFLDMLCDPDAYLLVIQGPDGEFWETDGNGNAFPTERALAYMQNDSSGSPQEFEISTGEKMDYWNPCWCVNGGVHTSYGDGKGGYRNCRVDEWNEWNDVKVQGETFQKWMKTTGYSSWKEWLGDNFRSDSVLQGLNQFCPRPDLNMQLTVDALRDTVVTASWKMVYAESDEAFEAIWDQMVKDCEGLGAQELIDWRLECLEEAKAIKASLE